MGLKNINLFEQHVEKIVLCVAGAGALAMGYLALQTVTIPDLPDPVGPKNVEPAITTEIEHLDDQRTKLENKGAPQPQIPNYVRDYADLSGDNPLGPLVSVKPPVFAPGNLPPSFVQTTPIDRVAAVIPDPAAPEVLHAEAMQVQVSVVPQQLGADGKPIPVPAGMQLPTQTKNVVAIDGYVPVGKMVLQMIKEPDVRKRFTADVQRGLVYRVRVMRNELLPNGNWSKDELVAAAKGSPAPDELLSTAVGDGELPAKIADIDAQFQLIQLPAYYVDSQGQPVPPPILARPEPKAISDENTKLENDITAVRAGAITGGFTPIAPGRGPGPVPGGGVGAVPAGPVMLPKESNQIQALQVQPFAFWDDSVQPDHTYKYKVQIQLVNPGLGWKWGLASPKMKDEPFLPLNNDGFAPVPGVITVSSDIAFFIRGLNFGGLGGISGRIFKQENGRWYWTEFTAQNGMDIGGQINLGPNNPMDVDTKFALVDFQQAGNNIHVILKDPSGNLVTRESANDWTRKDNDALYKKAQDAAAAAATAPAPGEVMATPVVTPTPPPATRGTPVRPPATRGAPVPVRPGG